MAGAESETQLSNEVRCPACGSRSWKLNVVYTTELILEAVRKVRDRRQSHEELRCCRCNKKATMQLEGAIRSTDEFKQAREKEEVHV